MKTPYQDVRLAGSAARLSLNADDKLLPGLVSLADAINRLLADPALRSAMARKACTSIQLDSRVTTLLATL